MLWVAFAIRVNSGYGSFQSTWESKIHPYSNPEASACRVNATIRSTEISGLRVIPNFMFPFRGSGKKTTAEAEAESVHRLISRQN
jgi:hypothetical protein